MGDERECREFAETTVIVVLGYNLDGVFGPQGPPGLLFENMFGVLDGAKRSATEFVAKHEIVKLEGGEEGGCFGHDVGGSGSRRWFGFELTHVL